MYLISLTDLQQWNCELYSARLCYIVLHMLNSVRYKVHIDRSKESLFFLKSFWWYWSLNSGLHVH
jgi:hypothetical protein